MTRGITVLCRPVRSGKRLVVARCEECGIVTQCAIEDGASVPLVAVQSLFYAGCRHAAHSSHAGRVPTLPESTFAEEESTTSTRAMP